MFQESHGFNIGHGEFTHVAGDYHQHNTNYAPGVPVNNIGSVTNANFGTNYGTIHQTSGASSPSPPHGGYPGYYGPPGGYWPPPSRPYSEPPPPHHGSPYYPPGGYWDGPPPRRQGPPSGPHPPPLRQQQGYPPQQNWNREVRSEQYGYPDSQGREGPSDRPPVPSQQRPPPNQRGYNDQPQQRRQQQQFNHEESRGSRGPSPAPQSDNRYPGGPQRGYSAPAANPAPNRRETFDDIYGSDYSNTPPLPESQNQPSSSKTKYRTPRASVDSDSDTEMDVEDTQYRLGNLHLSLTATDLTPVQAPKEKGKRGFMGLGKSKKAPA